MTALAAAVERVGPAGAPPQDLAAEQAVLGAMLMSAAAVGDVVELLRGTDFYRPVHELVFAAVVDLYSRGEPADAITVADELGKRGQLGRVGGHLYLAELISAVSVSANAAVWAHVVAEKAVLRRLLAAGTKVSQLAADQHGDVPAIVDAAQQAVFGVSRGSGGDDVQPLGALLEPALDEVEAVASGRTGGVPTGIVDLDRLTGGLHPGQMVIVAGRPGMGKSTLGLDFARGCAIGQGRGAAFFSLEMSTNEIVLRLLSAEGSIPLSHLRGGTMTELDWQRMATTVGRVNTAPLYVDDSPDLTMMTIRAKARRLKQQHDLQLVVIDYLQLLSSGRRVESRQVEVAEFSRQVKLLAKELGVPVVALSQLNRSSEMRSDKRPLASDLRESGGLEQDSDLIILLHRDDAYTAGSPRAGEADLIIAKHRNGPTGTVPVVFQGHYSRFADMIGGAR